MYYRFLVLTMNIETQPTKHLISETNDSNNIRAFHFFKLRIFIFINKIIFKYVMYKW